MSIVLTDGNDLVTLPDDLEWQDEYDWQAVERSSEYSLTGSLVVESAEKLAGRPITLRCVDDSMWVDRDTVDQLYAWADDPGITLTLTLRGVDRNVIFRHQDKALDAVPVAYMAPPESTSPYQITLRMMEI